MAIIRGIRASRSIGTAPVVGWPRRWTPVSLIAAAVVAIGVAAICFQIRTRRGTPMAVLDPKTGWTWLGTFASGNSIHCLAFSADGKLLLAGDDLGIVSVWDRSKDRPVRILDDHLKGGGDHKSVHAVAFDSGGTRLATGDFQGRIFLYDVPGFRRLACLEGHRGVVGSLAFAPDGRTLISAGDVGDGTIRLWDLQTHETVRSFAMRDEDGGIGNFARVDINPEGRIVAVERGGMGRDSAVYLLDRDDLTVVQSRPCERDATFSPGARYLAAASTSGVVTVYDTGSLAVIREVRPGSRILYRPTPSPDARLLAYAFEETIRDKGIVQLYDSLTHDVRRLDLGRQRAVRALAFSPDGRTLALGCRGGQVVLIPIDAEPK